MKHIKNLLITIIVLLSLGKAYALNKVELGTQYIPNPTASKALALGKIYIGKPDTDPVYFENQKTVSALQENGTFVTLTQPIYTNAGGIPVYSGAPVSLFVDGAYSLKILSSTNIQQYYIPSNIVVDDTQLQSVKSIDDLRSIDSTLSDGAIVHVSYHTESGDGGGGYFRWDSTSTAADNNGTIIQITGTATGRWIRSLDGSVVTIEMFGGGVSKDGLYNSTALNNAISSGYSNFKFGNGTYEFASGFTVTTPIYISGAGSKKIEESVYGTILKHTGSDDFFYVNLPSTNRGGRIENITLYSTSQTNAIFRLKNTYRFLFDHCEFDGGGYSVYAGSASGDNTLATMIEKCVIQLYGICGVYSDITTTDTKILNCDMSPTVASSAWDIINNGDGMLVSGCWLENGPGDRTGAGGHIWQPTVSGNLNSIRIVNNKFGRVGLNGGNHIRISGGRDVLISGNEFASSTSPTSELIYIDTLVGVPGYYTTRIVDNKFMNFIKSPVYIKKGWVDITGNNFISQDSLFVDTYFINREYNIDSNISVTGNKFSYDTSSAKYAALGDTSSNTPNIKIFSGNDTYNIGGTYQYVNVAHGNNIYGGTSNLADGIYVNYGSANGNRIRRCATGLTIRNGNCEGNYFELNTTAVSSTSSKVSNNIGDTQTITITGTAVQLWGITYVDTTTGALSGALSSGLYPGDVKTVKISTFNGTYSLFVTPFEGSTKTYTLTSAESCVVLLWSGTDWIELKDGSSI